MMRDRFDALLNSLSKINRRQATIYAIIVGLMSVTVGHVANYTGSFEPAGWRWLGWIYAISIDIGIIVCARFTEWKTTWLALPSFVLLMLASGTLNVVQVEPWLVGFGAWVYAILPTAAQALLGFLARDAAGLRKSRTQSETEKRLRAELKEANATAKQLRAELAQGRALTKAKDADFAAVCAKLDGNCTGRNVNIELARAGFEPMSESTIRSRLQ